jgi:hypothetical protein
MNSSSCMRLVYSMNLVKVCPYHSKTAQLSQDRERCPKP